MKYLKDLWDEKEAGRWKSDALGLLCYRSNLLGADLRITNFGGGNTSSKYEAPDPFSGEPVRVMAVKGSGGDLGSIGPDGFPILYLDKLEKLQRIYRGERHEDDMVDYYPLALFGENRKAASIDTPLHAFLPFPHIDHLHPDWGIALAASANGKEKLEEFNNRFGHRILWIPWLRPGFGLALMLRRAVEANPGCDGILLGNHGLLTWGNTPHECYLNSLQIIDHLGEFVLERQERLGAQIFGGKKFNAFPNAPEAAAEILPHLRGRVSSRQRFIAHYDASPDVLQFVNSSQAGPLARLGTSCPDHFVRTKIRPLYVDWNPSVDGLSDLKARIDRAVEEYRHEYVEYYESFAEKTSEMRDPDPSVVLIPGLGMFTFGKNKNEARITAEFYTNAIHVMMGATSLGDSAGLLGPYPQARRPEDARNFAESHNYVALPLREAFRIEYWALEVAKLKRMPAEKEFSRKISLVVGGGSGIGRAAARMLADRGAHVMVADKNGESAEETARMIREQIGEGSVSACSVDIVDRSSIAAALQATILAFGGIDGVINTAAIFPSVGAISDEKWRSTLDVNITGNYLLVDEAGKVFREQGLPGVAVLISSANAIVPKHGSEAYDVSKTAVNHLIRELAVGLAPAVRVNGIAPATVIEGSAMFSSERVITSLQKYGIAFDRGESLESLREKLAGFYARRTLTGLRVTPKDCAEAICFLAGERSSRITGHVLPVDGGLAEAFLR